MYITLTSALKTQNGDLAESDHVKSGLVKSDLIKSIDLVKSEVAVVAPPNGDIEQQVYVETNEIFI